MRPDDPSEFHIVRLPATATECRECNAADADWVTVEYTTGDAEQTPAPFPVDGARPR